MALTDCIGKLELELTHITAAKTTKDTHSLINSTNCGYQSAAVPSNDKKLTSYKVKQAAKVSLVYQWGIVSYSQAVESNNRGRVSKALQEQALSGTHGLLKKYKVKLEFSCITVTREGGKRTHHYHTETMKEHRLTRCHDNVEWQDETHPLRKQS
jgi:hypothetical protein